MEHVISEVSVPADSPEWLKIFASRYWTGSESNFPESIVDIITNIVQLYPEAREHLATSHLNTIRDKVWAACQACICKYCNKSLRFNYRSEFTRHHAHLKGEEVYHRDCYEEIKRRNERILSDRDEGKRHLLYKELVVTKQRLDIKQLSLTEVLYLAALLACGLSEDLSMISAPTSWVNWLTPTKVMDEEVLDTLYDKGLITPHPDSVLDAFTFAEDELTGVDITLCAWQLGFDNVEEVIADISEVLRTKRFPGGWELEINGLWQEIAINECLAYLIFAMAEHNLNFNPKDKTRAVIIDGLTTFPIGGIWHLIWKSVESVVAYRIRTNISKPHAANIVINNLGNKIAHYRANNWAGYIRGRNPDILPESQLSNIFFNQVVSVGNNALSIIIPRKGQGKTAK